MMLSRVAYREPQIAVVVEHPCSAGIAGLQPHTRHWSAEAQRQHQSGACQEQPHGSRIRAASHRRAVDIGARLPIDMPQWSGDLLSTLSGVGCHLAPAHSAEPPIVRRAWTPGDKKG